MRSSWFLLVALPVVSTIPSFGPILKAGGDEVAGAWALDDPDKHNTVHPAALSDGKGVRLVADTRVILVKSGQESNPWGIWGDHQIQRLDLRQGVGLQFTLDISGVACGCIACIYLVAMGDPSGYDSHYCDTNHDLRPGYNGQFCTEIDLMEANNKGWQTALHTDGGGNYGSGQCDKSGCFTKLGSGSGTPGDMQAKYGWKGSNIDTSKPFEVISSVDAGGAWKVTLSQDSKEVTAFSEAISGNPPGGGIPSSAKWKTKHAQGKLALVASLWKPGSNPSWPSSRMSLGPTRRMKTQTHEVTTSPNAESISGNGKCSVFRTWLFTITSVGPASYGGT